ncbi:zinc ribbon domain-containing protein [Aeromonas sp. HMWF014]|nr:zinc ribbon domain-containing protein [Aeromonas sp. HMWF014]
MQGATVHCKKCGNEISDTSNFCGNCGEPRTFINTAVGDGSVNIAGSNTISNSHLHVGDVYQAVPPKEQAYIDRTYVKQVTLAGSPVKTSWLIISGAVGFIGSWASIFSVLGSYWQYLFIIFLALSMSMLLNGIVLWKTRFSNLKWFNIESNKDGEVFITKVSGNCPKCDGTLKLVDIQMSKNSKKTFARCSRNGDHIWNFDPTVLD